MAICPAGHTSAADDFCDNCGLLISAPSQAQQPADPWGAAGPGRQDGFGPADPPAGTAGAGAIGSGCPNCGTPRTGRFCEGCGLDYNSGRLPGGGPPQSPPTVLASSPGPSSAGPYSPAPPGAVPDASWGSSFSQPQPPAAPAKAPGSYDVYQPTEMSRPGSAAAPSPGPAAAPPAWDPFGQQPSAQQVPDPLELHPPTQLAPGPYGQQSPAARQPGDPYDLYQPTEMSRPGSAGALSPGPTAVPPDPLASQGEYSAAQAGPPAPPAPAPSGMPYAQPDTAGQPSWGAPAASQALPGQQAGWDPQYQSGPAQSSGYPGQAAPPAWAPGPAGGSWSAVVSADRAYYDNVRRASGAGAQGIDFPVYAAERQFSLVGAQMRIGRHSASRGLYPEIDLTGPPTDPGISRLHAVLIARPDGGWAVLDPGSANGTMVNGTEIPANQQVLLRDGDRINLGAWTAITVQQA
jgi:hypothetical protein